MSDRIEPAQTPEQWAYFRRERSWGGAFYDEYVGSDAASCAENIALNNDALPDDDQRKIIPFHVALLRTVAAERDAGAPNGDDERAEELRHLANLLESYLPPE